MKCCRIIVRSVHLHEKTLKIKKGRRRKWLRFYYIPFTAGRIDHFYIELFILCSRTDSLHSRCMWF